MYDEYNTEVGMAQGGKILFGKAGGKFELHDNFSWIYGENDVAAKRIGYSILSLTEYTRWTASGILSAGTSVLLPGYGFHVMQASAQHSNLSVNIPQANIGAKFDFHAAVFETSAQITLKAAGGGGYSDAILYDYQSQELSSLIFDPGGLAYLTSKQDGIWSVAAINSSVTAQLAA